MQTLEIELPDQIATKLLELSQRLGITPECLLQIGAEEILTRLDEDFVAVAGYILSKNAELYRRLA